MQNIVTFADFIHQASLENVVHLHVLVGVIINTPQGHCEELGMPSFQKSAVFLNIVQKAFDPPPFYLNICPILRGVFFKRIFEH